MIVPFIVRLSLPVDPPAITRRIVAVRVDTVDCERFPVSVSQRPGVEGSEVVPFVAYPYAPFPVECVIRVVTAITTGFESAPYVINPSLSMSVFLIRSVLICYHRYAPSHL